MEIVNIVASGDLGVELDLTPLYTDITAENVQYDPEQFPGLQVRFSQEGPVIMLFSSGSYTIVGADTQDQVQSLYDRLNESLNKLGIEYEFEEGKPEIQNLICKGDLGREIDLDALVIALGLENVEYEPEQSPFVYYWPDGFDCLITIPTNGQCIVTGVKSIKEANRAFTSFREEVERLFSGE
ncbi:TATA-box-binding protein [Natronorubrum thiooxidans]|uniref:TATA binding protein of transcription factor TFIID n=1 Tax=Natronorubrum thiooxidans TaxID=308853 RepID=A0A1N7H0H1_9EURY|nr:hypothetical protein [Natronorubrum thiooxidans]SIS18344.1 TATA binding protein of transcription factor TFIID [Natronorubrum thiooxidans]